MGLLLLIIVIVLCLGGLPSWGYHSYGYAPSGLLTIVIVVVVICLITGRL